MAAPEDAARLIQDAIAELGWTADPAAIAEGVRRLDIGLPAEDEFAVVCSWLGQCELMHKLDQQQVPVSSRDDFQVPDLMAKFRQAKTPVLIEIKTSQANVLSFRPDYFKRLERYADMLGLPLLVGWKWNGLWMLFEPKHFRVTDKNHNVSWKQAMKQNLMGVLAGDVSFTIGEGAALHLSFRKDKLVGSENHDGSTTEEWKTVLTDVAFTGYDGERKDNLPIAVQSLLMTSDLDKVDDDKGSHIVSSFIATEPRPNFAHRALVDLLNWEARDEERPSWRALLRAPKVSNSVENLRASLDAALTNKVVQHVFQVHPHEIPDYVAVDEIEGATVARLVSAESGR